MVADRLRCCYVCAEGWCWVVILVCVITMVWLPCIGFWICSIEMIVGSVLQVFGCRLICACLQVSLVVMLVCFVGLLFCLGLFGVFGLVYLWVSFVASSWLLVVWLVVWLLWIGFSCWFGFCGFCIWLVVVNRLAVVNAAGSLVVKCGLVVLCWFRVFLFC